MRRKSLGILTLIVTTPLFAQASAPVRSVPRAQVVANAEAEFTKIDSDKDGAMSRAEIENFQNANNSARIAVTNAAVFKRLDLDNSGQISPSEFAKLNPVPPADATDALRIDANKDGKISRIEHRAATIDKFDRLDSNKDGSLTAEEVESSVKRANN